MNLFFKSIFILFLFYPSDIYAQAHILRNLLLKTTNEKPVMESLDELDREIKSFIESIYHNHRDKFRDGTVIRHIMDLTDEPSLENSNFRAAFYSVAIKRLPIEDFSRDPYFYIVGNFILELESRQSPEKISEMIEIISSSYFRLPSSEDNLSKIKQTIFNYVGRNFDYIHEKGKSLKILNKWWNDEDFRTIVFNSIGKEHLDNPDILLRWWKEDKANGTGRFKTFILPYLKKSQNNVQIPESDIFWATCLEASKSSISFTREINLLFNQMIGLIESLTPEGIKALDPEQLKSIHPRELLNLSFEQVQAFTPEQLRAFNPEQRLALIRISR